MLDIDFSKYQNLIFTYTIQYGTRLLVALIILFIGLWIIKRMTNLASRIMEDQNVDLSLRPFVRNVLNIFLRVVLMIVVISQIGLEVTSIIAVLGSVGLAIGLALQGSLSNFAGGVLLLALKPFRVGDTIDAQGVNGKVVLINIFNTVIKTADNKTIFIPNGPLANSVITNHDLETTRRVDLKFIIPAKTNVARVRTLISDILNQDNRILPTPVPDIQTEYLDPNVTVFIKAWAVRQDHGGIYWSLQDKILTTLKQEGIVETA